VVRVVRERFADLVCDAVVPRSVRVAEAPSYGKPITVFDPSSAPAEAYRRVAKELSGGAADRTR
jgi:chromosome partitioning protein